MDIDIDFADRNKALELFKHRIASRGNDEKHNSGVYFHEIPHNPLTNISSVPYKEAEKRGYFKIDFLNLTMYKDIKSEDHLMELMNTEPMWELLEHAEFVQLLNQVNGHAELLQVMKPRSVEQLAAVIAMIRPAKKHLIGKSWHDIMSEIWVTSSDDDAGYSFKKSHSICYALAIVVQMNLLCSAGA
jgi:DNA polymerase III alpha subunit